MNEAIEVVIFKAKAGVSDEQLRTAALAVTPILKGMPGFISREFGISENGQYIDVVHWKDLPSAKTAAEKVMGIPKCGEFFGLIDQNQMQSCISLRCRDAQQGAPADRSPAARARAG